VRDRRSPSTKCRRRYAKDGIKVVGLRFKGDRKCPPSRFERLRRELGEALEGHELEDESAASGRKRPHGVPTAEPIDEGGEPTRGALGCSAISRKG
jgi:hypothetical protein